MDELVGQCVLDMLSGEEPVLTEDDTEVGCESTATVGSARRAEDWDWCICSSGGSRRRMGGVIDGRSQRGSRRGTIVRSWERGDV